MTSIRSHTLIILVFLITLGSVIRSMDLLLNVSLEKQVSPLGFLFSQAMATEREIEEKQYTCPMHPHYISSELGTCPICGMDLVEIKNADAKLEMGIGENKRTAITIPAEMVQSMGVRTGIAERTRLSRSVRAFGSIVENTRLKASISSRVKGWIIDLKKNSVGDRVSVGDLFYTLYSPDLISAQQDFLNALRSGASSRKIAARRRLELLGVSKNVIRKIMQQDKVIENIPFFATASGTIVDLGISKGTYVTPMTSIASLQSFETVWVETSVAEKDIGKFKKGNYATISAPALNEWVGQGIITYIYPTVDKNTRTGRIRIELGNEKNLLKPGAFVNVVFDVEQSSVLAVPSEAILRSSKGAHVVAVLGQGRFAPLSVKTGFSSEGYTQIKSGLVEGQEVVVSGQFLIDSESALQESFAKLKKSRLPLSQLDIPEGDLLMIDHFIEAGLYIHEALIDGYDVTPANLQAGIDSAIYIAKKYDGTKLKDLAEKVKVNIETLRISRNETELFKSLNDLISTLERWIIFERAARYQERDLSLFKDQNSGFIWVQIGKEASNPYGTGEIKSISYKQSSVFKRMNIDQKAREVVPHVSN